MKLKTALRLVRFWPPYLGAGVKVVAFSSDLRSIDVEMKLRFWNKNYVGTHFGGSIYSMTDPFLMLMLLENLGRDYIVWDKAAIVQFKKPGRGRLKARFQISEQQIDEICLLASQQPKVEPVFIVNVMDEVGDVVAEVEKKLYVKRKQK